MKKLLFVLLLLGLSVSSLASGGSMQLEKAVINLGNEASMQRGAKYYVNYCMGCHALGYSRYNRVGRDLGISEDQLLDNLVFTTDTKGEKSKTGSLMTIAMTTAYGKEAFGTPPPDLSVISRSRGADWIYSYLKGFYEDKSRPFGVNNLVFEDVGMPNVMWDLQGSQKKKEAHDEADSHHVPSLADLEVSVPGSMNPAEFDQVALDLTNFLVYVGEPSQLARKKLAIWVMLFLAFFVVLTYLLKKEYWKDVH